MAANNKVEAAMITENIILGENTKYPLKGILTIPFEAKGPVPAVVFVHGSGSSNMDEKIGGLTPFKDLAEGLAGQGIASVRYDKRSFTHGLKMVTDKNLVITVKEETIEDAILATQLLKQDPRIDADNVFIVGHSMGGMLAPRIDAEGGDYKGLVIMAGSLRKLEDVLVAQSEEAMESLGPIVKKIGASQIKKMTKLFEGLYDLSDEEAKKKKAGGGTTLYYFKEMGENAPANYLKDLDKPVLVMQGEKDFQVKADLDFVQYKEVLADKPNATFKLYENLNHAFVQYQYDNISKAKQEYKKERHIPNQVITDIADWIKSCK